MSETRPNIRLLPQFCTDTTRAIKRDGKSKNKSTKAEPCPIPRTCRFCWVFNKQKAIGRGSEIEGKGDTIRCVHAFKRAANQTF